LKLPDVDVPFACELSGHSHHHAAQAWLAAIAACAGFQMVPVVGAEMSLVSNAHSHSKGHIPRGGQEIRV